MFVQLKHCYVLEPVELWSYEPVKHGYVVTHANHTCKVNLKWDKADSGGVTATHVFCCTNAVQVVPRNYIGSLSDTPRADPGLPEHPTAPPEEHSVLSPRRMTAAFMRWALCYKKCGI